MTSYPCPACLTEANLETGCPGCGRAPDPAAAEVIQLGQRIAELKPRVADAQVAVERAKAAYTALVDELSNALYRRDWLAAEVRAAVQPPVQPAVPAVPPPLARPETSTQTVKNVLFVLGGILLSIAAIVFTAFAWGTYGTGGKAAILGVFTGATLGVPLVALRRNLRGTAETFAALGLLLVALDGYAVWLVNLGGVRQAASVWTYAGVVAAITAATSVAYGRWTRLTAPAVFGLAATQPVLPLISATLIGGRAAGVALVFTVVAAANLSVVRSRSAVLPSLALIAYAISLTVAHGYAFAALLPAEGTGAVALGGGVTLLAGAVALAGPVLRPHRIWLTAATAWCTALVVLVGWTAARLAPDHALLWTVGLIAALAFATSRVELRCSKAVWSGMLYGVAATGGVAALIVAPQAAATAALLPAENVSIEVVLLTLAAVALTRRTQPILAGVAAVAGTIGLALAIPAGFNTPWLAPAADLTTIAVLFAAVLWLRPQDAVRAIVGLGAVILPGHAIAVSADRPAQLAYTLGVLLVLAIATAAMGRWRDEAAGIAAVAVSGPLAVGLAVAAARTVHSDVIHTMVSAAAGLPLAVWAVRRWYARAADLAVRATILVTMLIAVLAPGEDTWARSVYVAGAAVALAVLPRAGLPERIAGWAVLGLGLLAARPPLLVVVEPYAWLFRDVTAPTARLADVIAIAVLTAALWSSRPLLFSALPVPIALAVVHFGLVWPWLPLVLLVSGLALVAYAVWKSPWCAPFGLLLAGSGLSGLSVEYWSLITGLALVCAFSLAVAVFSRVRVPASLVFAAAWLGLAVTSARAAHLSDRGMAFTVLSAAAVLLLASVVVHREGGRVLEVPAHLAALGVIVTVPSAARLSEACLVWGVALGLSVSAGAGPRRSRSDPRRARPGSQLKAPWRLEWLLRLTFAGALEIAALWALLISRDVAAVEAYSLPLAGVALIVGFLAMRRDPSLTSWIGYGPGLVAAFGPSLAVILPVAGDLWRRLGLGLAGLVIVLAGSVRRRQAPVVIGGAVLIVVALHEATQVWTALPPWVPIGIGGAILVALAITYERRLRDLRTLRSRISSFT